jgi:hypothetical protein
MSNRINKRPLHLGRSVRAGIKVGVFILTAICTVEIARLSWITFQNRIGAPGGEILIIPMMILLFYSGWTASKEWAELKGDLITTERREYHGNSSGSPAYKG